MRELQQKQKLKQRIYSWPSLIALALVTVFILNGAYSVMKKRHDSIKYVEELRNKGREIVRKANRTKGQYKPLGDRRRA